MKTVSLAAIASGAMAAALLSVAGADGRTDHGHEGDSRRLSAVVDAPGMPGINRKVARSDVSHYNFESGTQGWVRSGAPILSLARTTSMRYAGHGALAVRISGAGTASASVMNPEARAGQIVSYRIYVPTDARIHSVQPFVLQDGSGQWAWTGQLQDAAGLKRGEWNTLTVQVPTTASALSSIGVQFTTDGVFEGTLYVDSVDF
jgi:hypothetical protein